jgi:hypothetical protein
MSQKVSPAAPNPCSACPWRTANHGKRHPDGWYTKANRARLWRQLRQGENMTCHPTDPSNPVPEGHPCVPEGAQTLECSGALILQQRELMRFQAVAHQVAAGTLKGRAFALYRKLHPGGMTLAGLGSLVERAVFGGVFGVQMSKPDLRAEVGHDALAPWTSTDEEAL